MDRDELEKYLRIGDERKEPDYDKFPGREPDYNKFPGRDLMPEDFSKRTVEYRAKDFFGDFVEKDLFSAFNPEMPKYDDINKRINPITSKIYPEFGNFSGIDYGNNIFTRIYKLSKAMSDEYIDYQFSLARMDVRDGKLSQKDYDSMVNGIGKLVQKMNTYNFPLGMISSANGLDEVLKSLEKKF